MFSAEELIQRLKPLLGHKHETIWQSYLANDPKGKSELDRTLALMDAQHVDGVMKERVVLKGPERFEDLHGEYPVGMATYAGKAYAPFALQTRELTQHLGIFGRTGAGKSFLVKGLLQTHIHYGQALLVFDWKATYKDLPGVVYHEPGGGTPFYFNPLAVDALPFQVQKGCLHQVVGLFLDSFLEDLKLLTVQGVEALLLQAVDAVQKTGGGVTFFAVSDFLKQYRGPMREMDWRATALNLLDRLLQGPMGDMLSKPCSLEELMQGKMVLDLGLLGGGKERSFFVRSLLLHLFYYAQQKGPTRTLRLLIVIEEAHQVLLRKEGGRESVIEMLLRMAREYGLGICLVDQHPSRMSYPALGTYATIAFALKLGQDRSAMASALNLSQTELLGRLPRQHAIVKLSDRFLTPFLIRTFDQPLSKPCMVPVHLQEVVLAVEELRQKNGSYWAIGTGMVGHDNLKSKTRRCDRLTKDKTEAFSGVLSKGQCSTGENGIGGQYAPDGTGILADTASSSLDNTHLSKRSTPSVLSPQTSDPPPDGEILYGVLFLHPSRRMKPAESLLCHVYAHPLMSNLKRYQALKWSAYQGNRWRRWLLSEGLICSEDVAFKHGQIRRLRPTSKGFRWLQENGFSAWGSKKRVGLEHDFWQRRIVAQCKRLGYRAEMEYPLRGQEAVDVMVKNGNKRVAIEVETGANAYADMVRNVEKSVGHFEGIILLMLCEKKIVEVKNMTRNAILVSEEGDCLYHIKRILGEGV